MVNQVLGHEKACLLIHTCVRCSSWRRLANSTKRQFPVVLATSSNCHFASVPSYTLSDHQRRANSAVVSVSLSSSKSAVRAETTYQISWTWISGANQFLPFCAQNGQFQPAGQSLATHHFVLSSLQQFLLLLAPSLSRECCRQRKCRQALVRGGRPLAGLPLRWVCALCSF